MSPDSDRFHGEQRGGSLEKESGRMAASGCRLQESVRGKVLAAGGAMIALGSYGVLVSIWFMTLGFWGPVFLSDDDIHLRHLGEVFLFWFGLFFGGMGLLPNLVVLAGGVAMVRFRSRPLALAGAILALVNSCQLGVFGVAIGIWALIVLTSPEVKAAFEEARARSSWNASVQGRA